MGVYIWSRLPSEYQEVEYIQSSGTQYINTGYNPVVTTKVQAKVMITGYRENGGPIYGVWYNYSGATRFCGWYENGGVWFGYGGNNGSNNIVQCSTNTILNIEQYTSSGTSHNIVNGTDNSYTGASFSTQNYPIYLFARNNGASDIDKRLYLRIYSFKIYTGDTLVRNFVPCYRKSDSVIGLYDLVNNQFYTNSGSGTFTKGSDVDTYRESLLKNAYIGEVYEYSYDFRNKTSSQIQADGWTYTNTPLFDANGMYYSTWNSILDKTISQIGTHNKVTLECTFSTVYSSEYAITCYLVNSSKGNQYGLYTDSGTSTSTTDGTTRLKINGSNEYSTTTRILNDGLHSFKLELDLSNKTYNCSAPISKTGTLTDAQITALRQYKNIRILVASPGIRYKTLSVTYES